MTTVAVNVKIDDKLIRSRLDRLARSGGDMRGAFNDIGEYMLRVIEDERFNIESGPDGSKWEELNDAYRETKKHPKIGTESGDLRGSYVYRAGSNQVEIGTNRVYAALFEFGGRTKAHEIRAKNKKALFWSGGDHPVKVVQHPGGDHPARPVLGLSSRDRREILAILRERTVMALRGK